MKKYSAEGESKSDLVRCRLMRKLSAEDSEHIS